MKAVSRNPGRLEQASQLGARCFEGMVGEDAWHDFAADDVDYVVNCVSSAGGGMSGYRQSYLDGNESLGRWVSAFGFSGSAVYTSSVSVYGDAGGAWVDEERDVLPASSRGRLMRESEQIFLEALPTDRAAALRLGGLYGPSRHLMLDKIRSSSAPLPGLGDYFLNLLRVEDAASAIWACLDSPAPLAPILTAVDNEPAQRASIARWMADRLGLPMPEFMAGASGGSRRLSAGESPANRKVSNRLLKRSCRWEPRFPSFREGFGDLIQRG